jgi:hypothetical protein
VDKQVGVASFILKRMSKPGLRRLSGSRDVGAGVLAVGWQSDCLSSSLGKRLRGQPRFGYLPLNSEFRTHIKPFGTQKTTFARKSKAWELSPTPDWSLCSPLGSNPRQSQRSSKSGRIGRWNPGIESS